ncbi:Paf1p SKDI_02G3860 [Saccharomyces kudriavzevii IFO 1802]|uniref:PAF1-like protein n=1 Tax=Saccharomyces kudriavzevii (strain ATCC MYA-4449 / AS 2.2408 / CBS 8840 / NBRC 1802 / NCYC 2889) TaxID=226230 RepID=A0AA35JBR1_SACK1|nr:uncharacterized protein SKDI_02G3860 [Saccharomyces kudriavzevii IFO 1802]CAI4056147.1 hypothetical protein SKDI_02G3860 [Saccharomyces kudriavzevii IFO 1802]
MSKKQEYIAPIKYQNSLPVPQLPPKLLVYEDAPETNPDSSQLINSLYTKTNVSNLIQQDDDLGMPVDLMKFPGLLNKLDSKLLYGFDNVKLAKDDRILLRDPRIDRLTRTDVSKVTFLRRTEYVSNTIAAHDSTFLKRKRGLGDEDSDDENLDVNHIIKRVEKTFNKTDTWKHPVKKGVKMVKKWDLLPDTASMDQIYFILKFMGSASLDSKEKKALTTGVFRPVELEEDEWISMYATDHKDSVILETELEKGMDEMDDDSHEGKVYKFKRIRDYDMKQVAEKPMTELAIRLNDKDGIAYYKPLRSKIELRRRRVNDIIKPLVKEHDIDQLNITLRNPSTKEANIRDKLRMKFDPINFATVDEEDEEEEEKHDDAKEELEEDLEKEDPKPESVSEQDEVTKQDAKPAPETPETLDTISTEQEPKEPEELKDTPGQE